MCDPYEEIAHKVKQHLRHQVESNLEGDQTAAFHTPRIKRYIWGEVQIRISTMLMGGNDFRAIHADCHEAGNISLKYTCWK
jgi:hypothetical protein